MSVYHVQNNPHRTALEVVTIAGINPSPPWPICGDELTKRRMK